MDVAAPPHPPQVGEFAGDDAGEALIKEARQRARRRRLLYGVAAMVVALAAVAAFSIRPGSPSPPSRAARNAATPPTPTPLGAPEVQGPNLGSTLLTSYAEIHDGYVYVYADGRVIWHNDAGGEQENPTYDRRLSAAGLELVRSGVLTANDLKDGNSLPSDVWIDPPNTRYTPWAPSEYAGCLFQEASTHDRNSPAGTSPFRDATSRLGDVPATAQALLHTRRMFPGAGLLTPDPVADDYFPRSACFALTPAETRALLDRNGPNPFEVVELIPASPVEGAIILTVFPVLPHGAMLGWGG